jgi:hypothetical protein
MEIPLNSGKLREFYDFYGILMILMVNLRISMGFLRKALTKWDALTSHNGFRPIIPGTSIASPVIWQVHSISLVPVMACHNNLKDL